MNGAPCQLAQTQDQHSHGSPTTVVREIVRSAPVWRAGGGRTRLVGSAWRRLAIVLLALALPATLSLLIWTVERLRLPTPAHLELSCSGYELNVQFHPTFRRRMRSRGCFVSPVAKDGSGSRGWLAITWAPE